MKLFVCVKQVPDTETKIKIKPDTTGVDTTGYKWITSPYDEIAIEQSLRVKEKNPGSTVTAISVGPARVIEVLRKALAMGVDHALHIDAPETLDSYLTAKSIVAAIEKSGGTDIVFTGKEAIDDGANQVGQAIASLLKIPCVGVVFDMVLENQNCICKREIEGGSYEVVHTSLPVVVTTQKGLNEPRYPNVQSLMQAKKKEITAYALKDLNLSLEQQKIRYTHFELPPPKQVGKKIDATQPEKAAKELLRLLKDEAKVIS